METPPPRLSEAYLEAAVDLLTRSESDGTVRVQGASMRPTLRQGDVVAVEFRSHPPSFGEVVLFRQGDCLLVHRCLGTGRRAGETRCWRTRGDGSAVLDPPLTEDRILGRVTAVRTARGWRSFRGARARAYAWAIGLHLLVWSGMRSVAPAVARNVVAAVDRWKVHVLHFLLFRLCHPRTEGPSEADRAGGTPAPGVS